MPRKRLTDSTLKALTPIKKRYDVMDTDVRVLASESPKEVSAPSF
jgi:hypothetical protein